jgi:hypothetical protein
MTYTKFHGNRATQLETLRKQGWRVVTFKECSLVVAFNTLSDGRISAKGWRGNADKPAWYYGFRDVGRAEQYVTEFARQVKASEDTRAGWKKDRQEKRAALKAADHWAVGDVIYNSWGYDQTNIDWYQVVEVKPKSIVIRAIADNCSDVGGPSGGRTAPRRNEFTGKPLLKPCDESGRISMSHGCATKWDGRAKGCSSYH